MSTLKERGIIVENVSISYGNHTVLKDVYLKINPGGIMTLLGPNGCGKTTLLKVINGLLRPSQGQIFIEGRASNLIGQMEQARLIGYVPQAQRASFPFTVMDIVLTGRMPHLSMFAQPGPDDVKKAKLALEMVGATHLTERPYTQISGGERQLVMIARALAQEPKYLLLDEPTSYLDFKNQILILKMITDIARKQGVTVVMTLHDPNHSLMFSDEIVLLRKLSGLNNGHDHHDNLSNLVAVGTPLDVMTEHNIKDAYGLDVDIVDVKGRRLLLPL